MVQQVAIKVLHERYDYNALNYLIEEWMHFLTKPCIQSGSFICFQISEFYHI